MTINSVNTQPTMGQFRYDDSAATRKQVDDYIDKRNEMMDNYSTDFAPGSDFDIAEMHYEDEHPEYKVVGKMLVNGWHEIFEKTYQVMEERGLDVSDDSLREQYYQEVEAEYRSEHPDFDYLATNLFTDKNERTEGEYSTYNSENSVLLNNKPSTLEIIENTINTSTNILKDFFGKLFD